MKKVVLLNDLVPSDIISSFLYKEYIKYIERDIETYFLNSSSFVDVVCPGCATKNNSTSYKKMKMDFKICSKCASHYVSPRPNKDLLEKFYRESKACRYWRRETLNLPESQLYYIYGPRVNWISEIVDELISEKPILLDIETKYPYLLKHLLDENICSQVLAIRPLLFEKLNLLPSHVLVKQNLGDYSGKIGMITAFETIERMFNPADFFVLAKDCCKKNGLLLITTASCSGFEYQALGKYAPNINPINRMNLLSMEALKDRIQTAGFDIVEFSTPGRLDAEIVRDAIKKLDKIDIDPFWRYIFNFRDEKTWRDFQNFLQVNQLSSHVRIVAQKK